MQVFAESACVVPALLNYNLSFLHLGGQIDKQINPRLTIELVVSQDKKIILDEVKSEFKDNNH